MLFPKSMVHAFYTSYRYSGQRTGQQFYNFMQLHKCSDRELCDKIYELDGLDFVNFIQTVIDWEN